MSTAMTLLVEQAIDLIHQGVDQLAQATSGNHRAVPLFRQALEVVKELSSMDCSSGTLVFDFVPLTRNDTLPWTAVRLHYSSPATAPSSSNVVNALSAVIIYHLGLVHQIKYNSAKALALYQQVDRLLLSSSSSSSSTSMQALQSLVWNNLAWMVMWNDHNPEDARRRFHDWNRFLVNIDNESNNRLLLQVAMAMVLLPPTAASAAAA